MGQRTLLVLWLGCASIACGDNGTGPGPSHDAAVADGAPDAEITIDATDAVCGDGTRQSTETCDTALDACCNSTCTGFATAGTSCRAAIGSCDAAETCTGASASCPADGFVGAGMTCRVANGLCDVAETCTGTAAACPVDGFSSGNVCRVMNGVCDVAETCAGTGPSCPSQGFASTGVCRISAGDCDPAESCNGSAATCPIDGFASENAACDECADAPACECSDVGTCELRPRNCADLLAETPGLPSGVYAVQPGADEITVVCDMTTAGGGWTLVLLNDPANTPGPDPDFAELVSDVNITGNLSATLLGFDLFLGVGSWEALGTTMRIDFGVSPSVITHRATYPYSLDEASSFALSMGAGVVDIGVTEPGMKTFHAAGNHELSARDVDNDTVAGASCYSNYLYPWWYGGCWSGSLWGGRGPSGHTDAAYWTGGEITAETGWAAIWVR